MRADALYFRQRAREEEEAARHAAHPLAREAHCKLAARYAAEAEALEEREPDPAKADGREDARDMVRPE